jgi:ubiquinone/menaquinone biosynthesis C-methylase UbiE
MSTKKFQKEAFLSYEADNYFQRNKSTIENYSSNEDIVINLLKEYNYQPKKILEIGCNAGYRLNGIKNEFPNSEVFGLEPSKEAINFGKSLYGNNVEFHNGTADDLSCFESETFDLVIIGFVMYVVDRSILLKTISEIDRVTKNKGLLINIEFLARVPQKVIYAHIKEVPAFTFKQTYEDIFIASKLYQFLDKRNLNHNSKSLEISEDYDNNYSVTILRKDLMAGYI